MKKHLIGRVAIALLLGAITTVAVAWAALHLGRYKSFANRRVDMDTLDWKSRAVDADALPMPPAKRYRNTLEWMREARDAHRQEVGIEDHFWVTAGFCRGLLSDETAIRFGLVDTAGGIPWPGDLLLDEVRLRVGWPARAFAGRRRVTGPGTDKRFEYHVLFATNDVARDSYESGLLKRPVVPLKLYRPIFSGVLINTLFYGAIWFTWLFGFGAARRGLRKKRGRCPMCAYDLRGGTPQAGRLCHQSPGCPECGWNRSDDPPPGEAGG